MISAVIALVHHAPRGQRRRRARKAAAATPGGEITYGLEAETAGGCCPTSEQPAAAGIMVDAAIYDTLSRRTTRT